MPLIITHPADGDGRDRLRVLFSRWVQEQFFRDMRDACNPDALPEHGFETLDDDTLAVIPAH